MSALLANCFSVNPENYMTILYLTKLLCFCIRKSWLFIGRSLQPKLRNIISNRCSVLFTYYVHNTLS